MGEQVSQALENGLAYIGVNEFERILKISDSIFKNTLFANMARINALYMIARSGSGHIGSSFSSLDIVSWLHLEEMQAEDIFFSSKGHDAPGFYAAMIGLGRLPFEKIHGLRRLTGLPGHPDVNVAVCATNTGSLGMGISKAKGMLYARKTTGKSGNIFVMTGDGELQEGQIWESLISAANNKLHNLIVIVDHNQLQSDTFVSTTSDLGDLVAKFLAFGWHVERCNGHDLQSLADVFTHFRDINNKPKILIADTIKGRGVSFMEHTSLDSDIALYRFHSGAPDHALYAKALDELVDKVNQDLQKANMKHLVLNIENNISQLKKPLPTAERLILAYSKALIAEAEKNPKIVALDADLILDTGLIPFRETFPERLVECGIAEQDMVSQAGGMALMGLLPVVHSFACFLSARPNEQIYNNATEKTRIVYVGSLAGVVPGGPGHSHQAVRDIAALSAIPGLEMFEPSCEAEVHLGLNYCLNKANGPSYLRLVSIPCEIPYSLPENYQLEAGKGVILREGKDVAIFAYGPILLTKAWHAALNLNQRGISVRLINLPWLNQINEKWLMEIIAGCKIIFTLDNHQIAGGQGQQIAAILGKHTNKIPMQHFGINEIPVCGTNDEVLTAHGLDTINIETVIFNSFNQKNIYSTITI